MSKDNIIIDPERLRTNYKIISSTSEPVYTSSVSTNNPAMPSITQEITCAYASLGKRFSTNTGNITSIGANSYIALLIIIPANWGKTMYVDRIRIGTSTTSVVDCMPAVSVSGTTLTNTNSNFASTNTSTVVCKYIPISSSDPFSSITATPVQTCVLAGGTYEQTYNGRFIMPSTSAIQYFGIRVQNTGTGSSSAMISFSWWEV